MNPVYQTIETHVMEITAVVELTAVRSLPFDGGCRFVLDAINEKDTLHPFFDKIKQAACNAVNGKYVFGATVSRCSMIILTQTRVTVDGKTLTPQFEMITDGTDFNFARYSLKQ